MMFVSFLGSREVDAYGFVLSALLDLAALPPELRDQVVSLDELATLLQPMRKANAA